MSKFTEQQWRNQIMASMAVLKFLGIAYPKDGPDPYDILESIHIYALLHGEDGVGIIPAIGDLVVFADVAGATVKLVGAATVTLSARQQPELEPLPGCEISRKNPVTGNVLYAAITAWMATRNGEAA